MCREALQQEAAVVCLLAKVDSEALAFDASTSKSNGSSGEQDSSITVVVQEGLEVRLPMAGQLSALLLDRNTYAVMLECMLECMSGLWS